MQGQSQIQDPNITLIWVVTPLSHFFSLPAISSPTNLHFSQVGPTSFTIHWAVPGQENRLTGLTGLTGYRVVVNPKDKSGPTKEINLAPDTTQAHISGLMVSEGKGFGPFEKRAAHFKVVPPLCIQPSLSMCVRRAWNLSNGCFG